MTGNNQGTAVAQGHHPLFGQPHSGEEGPIAESERTRREAEFRGAPAWPAGAAN